MSSQHPYTTEHIKLYLEGKLSAAEMHALEKAAMDDPFLADAIEGMEMMKESNTLKQFDDHSTELQDRLTARITQKQQSKVLGFGSTWYKIAAVLTLVATGLVVVLVMNETSRVAPVTVAKKQEKIAPKQTQAMVVDSPPEDSQTKDSPTKKVRKPVVAVDKPKPQELPLEEVQQRKVEAQTEQKDLTFEAPAAKQDTVANASAPEKALQGRVAGVTVSNGTAKTLSKKQTLRNVEPEGGWPAFELYLDSNKIVAAPDSAIHGPVTVAFTIDARGRPTSINVATSLSPAHDEKAVKLISEGPSWKVLRGKTRNVTLSINF